MKFANKILQIRGESKRGIGKVKSGCGTCGKAKNILKGFTHLVLQNTGAVDYSKIAVPRLERCYRCLFRTWLTGAQWLKETITKDTLPVNLHPSDGAMLWCSKCKCRIDAKVLVEEEKCPEGIWEKEQRWKTTRYGNR